MTNTSGWSAAADPVPFLDVGATYRELRAELDAAYQRVMASGWFLLGAELEAFEHEFATAMGARFAVGVGSGLDALALTLRALGVGPGDEVIVPAHTFVATWLAVSTVGARPVPVDPDETTGVVTADAVCAAIGPRTAAVVPVHLTGLPVDLGPLCALADRHGLAVVADAAQAHGATCHDRPVGAFGRAAAWSFYPGKNLGAFADGGAVTTDDPALAERVRRLRNYGSVVKYEHLEAGVNSRLDELQAAFLRVKLAHLPAWNQRRRAVADRYRAGLAGLPVALPVEPDGRRSAWHLYVVRTDRRDALAAHLAAAGIGTGIHYPTPPHRQPAYADAGPWPDLPVADRLAATVLSLPIGPHLAADAVDRVIDGVRSFCI